MPNLPGVFPRSERSACDRPGDSANDQPFPTGRAVADFEQNNCCENQSSKQRPEPHAKCCPGQPMFRAE